VLLTILCILTRHCGFCIAFLTNLESSLPFALTQLDSREASCQFHTPQIPHHCSSNINSSPPALHSAVVSPSFEHYLESSDNFKSDRNNTLPSLQTACVHSSNIYLTARKIWDRVEKQKWFPEEFLCCLRARI
jgi:hypothetical protein